MALRVLNRFPGANAAVLSADDRAHEVVFAPEPRPGAEALWFQFRVVDPQPPSPPPAALRVKLAFADSLSGLDAAAAAQLRPVYREKGSNWLRARPAAAVPAKTPADVPALVWELPWPARDGSVDVALDVPYGPEDLAATVRRSNGFWTETAAGLLAGGALLRRLSSGQPPSPSPRALYVAARRDPAAAPASWVLDGMLEAFSRAKSAKWRVWAAPFADPTGAERGASGPDPAKTPRLRALLAADFARCAAGARPELYLDLDAAPPGGTVRAAAAPCADPAAEKSARAWVNLFAQALAPDWADADSFAAPEPAPEENFPALDVPRLSVRVPFGRIRNASLAPRQYREIGQRLAKAVLGRW